MMIFLKKFCLFLIFLICSNTLYARKAYPRDNFPSKEDVFEKIKGNNEKETLLKQAQTFIFLKHEIDFISDLSPKEKELLNEYKEGLKIVYDKYDKNIAPLNDKSNLKEYQLVLTNPIETELKDFIVNKLFDEKTRKNYLEEIQIFTKRRAEDAQKRKANNEAFDTRTKLYARMQENEREERIFYIFAFFIGLILSLNMLILDYFYGRRIFNRKNQSNDSYNMIWGKAIAKTLIGCISIGLMLLGIVIVAGTFDKVFG